jgi:hypothetical protein
MKLNKKQFQFSWMVGQLIIFYYQNGYTIQLGDARAKTGHKKGSFHGLSLAIDINLFKDGKYLKDTKDHLLGGEFWMSIGGSWGGLWDDGNHYSLGEG